MSLTKIDSELLENEGRFHTALEDVPQKNAQEMKEFMDYIPRQIVIPKINEMVDKVNGKSEKSESYTKNEIDIRLDKKAEKEKVYEKADVNGMLTNLLRPEVISDRLYLKDISPLPHKIQLHLERKNLLPYPFYHSVLSNNGIDYEAENGGCVIANGTASASSTFVIYQDYYDKYMPDGFIPGQPYTVSLTGDQYIKGMYLVVNYYNETPGNNNYISWLKAEMNGEAVTGILPEDAIGIKAYLYVPKNQTLDDVIIFPQIERGYAATPFASYIESLVGEYVIVTAGDELKEYYCDENGNLPDIDSYYPEMQIEGGENVLISCRYSKDITSAYEELYKIAKGLK